MDNLIGLIGWDQLVADVVTKIRKGKHVILTGPVGIGKSAVLKAALEKVDGKIELIIRLYDHQAIRAVCGNGQADADAGFDQCTGIGFASTIP